MLSILDIVKKIKESEYARHVTRLLPKKINPKVKTSREVVNQINFNTVSKPLLKKQKTLFVRMEKKFKNCCFRCSFYLQTFT